MLMVDKVEELEFPVVGFHEILCHSEPFHVGIDVFAFMLFDG